VHAPRRSPLVLLTFASVIAACGRPAPSLPPTPAPPEPPPPPVVSVVPQPVRLEIGNGQLALNAGTHIAVSDVGDSALMRLADQTAALLNGDWALAAVVDDHSSASAPAEGILLALDPQMALPDEGYRLDVTDQGVTIRASTHAGIFYGIQTLRQLLPVREPRGAPTVREVSVEDWPRFPYRGMHLDVGRHFFPVSFVKRYIDLLAMYKMNRFHWHLTEDQGWRIEIKKYPRLTEVGAYRKETILEKNRDPYVGDGIPYGGYYTQDEIRDVVAYAADRYVTVVPEIEMPGHSLAAITAYPEFACTDGPFEVGTRWGIFQDIYCPKDTTFTFLEDVLTEVMDLFPSQYIHIGGDEAPKQRWEASPIAQDVIQREGLADESELQSYFIRRIEQFLIAHGRRLIGWDEILEGGLAPEATVMSWRGMQGGIEAAQQGHDVIMTPVSHVYFDYYQGDRETEPLAIGGFTPLEKVYQFEPVPPDLTPDEAKHVLGAQGNLWTEYIATGAKAEYMAVPRMLALAEVVWSPAEQRDWRAFAARLRAQLKHLDVMGVNYRTPTDSELASP